MHNHPNAAHRRHIVEQMFGRRVVDFLRFVKRRAPFPHRMARRFFREVWPATRLEHDTARIDPARETVLLVIHQATRTGAPILGYNLAKWLGRRYNVVALLMRGGELTEDFEASCSAVVGPLVHADWQPTEIERVLERITSTYAIKYVVANSIDTRIAYKPLTLSLVPVVSLVHEFASHLRPPGEMGRALEWATEIVFSARVVAQSVRAEYPNLDNRAIHILPQGRAELPPRAETDKARQEGDLRRAIRPPGAEDAFVVLGCGTITYRKGVDVFLSCAAAVTAQKQRRPVRFVWIGRASPSEMDHVYAIYLSEQLARCGLEGSVVILDEVADLGPAFAAADAFFISSRLDPLPNVGIDAAFAGLPIVCFENGTGFAELLGAREATRRSVVPYLDYAAAARLIARLADDERTLRELGRDTKALAEATFDMERYAADIDRVGCEAARKVEQRREDLETIGADPAFDLALYEGPAFKWPPRRESILYYLARSAAYGTGKHPTVNFYYRRPCPGFHPQIYAHERNLEGSVVDPLAHYLRDGKPEGPWRHEVIRPSDPAPEGAGGAELRTALHGHFFYPELIGDLLRKLKASRSRLDLLLSTTDDDKERHLLNATRGYTRGKVVVRIVPNRGRDIGAFLTGFGQDIAGGSYDVVGHVHGKRSLFLGDNVIGDSWREFMWQHLIGDRYPMMDIILARLACERELGLVFPEEPHLADWDMNRPIAEGLARRMGMALPLPPFFDFPVGTMFWARAQALAPLVSLKLDWSDYPQEPLPIDGTILHTLERLLPFSARHAGYRYATTHIAGVTW
jgi:glycosyltransferase involved in cell wall biosynthesis